VRLSGNSLKLARRSSMREAAQVRGGAPPLRLGREGGGPVAVELEDGCRFYACRFYA